MLDKLELRREIGNAARRIEAASSATAFCDDPHVAALIDRWRKLSRATSRALEAMEAAIDSRRAAVTAEDRKFIDRARKDHPDLLMLEDPGCERMPLLCMVTGLAVFASDRMFGSPETGYVVLKRAMRVVRAF